jgi:WD40 repeat protein
MHDMRTMNIKLLLCSLILGGTAANAQNLAWAEKCAPVSKETYAVAFSQDGNKVFSGSECTPTSLRIFDAANGGLYWETTLDSPLMCAQGVKFNSNGSKVVTLEELGNLIIYDYTTTTPTQLTSIATGTNYAFAVAFSPDGNKLVTGCSNTKMIIHDINTSGALHNVAAHSNWVTGVDWSVNEKIVTCGDDGKIKLWDTAGNNIWTITGHMNYIGCVRFSSDGNYIISASRDKTVKIWNASDGSIVRTLTGHTREVKYIDVSDDMAQIVSGAIDSTIRVWDFNTGSLLHTFSKPNSGKVYCVDFKPGTTRFITAGTSNGDVQVWDMLFPAGVETVSGQRNILLSPNPCIDELVVTNAVADVKAIRVTDIAGRIYDLQHKNVGGKLLVNTKDLAPGNYVLSAGVGAENVSFHFTKQ